MFYYIVFSGIFYNVTIKYSEKTCSRNIPNSKSHVRFICLYINLFKYLKGMRQHKKI